MKPQLSRPNQSKPIQTTNLKQLGLAFNLPAGVGFTAGLAYGLGATAGTSLRTALFAPRIGGGSKLQSYGYASFSHFSSLVPLAKVPFQYICLSHRQVLSRHPEVEPESRRT